MDNFLEGGHGKLSWHLQIWLNPNGATQILHRKLRFCTESNVKFKYIPCLSFVETSFVLSNCDNLRISPEKIHLCKGQPAELSSSLSAIFWITQIKLLLVLLWVAMQCEMSISVSILSWEYNTRMSLKALIYKLRCVALLRLSKLKYTETRMSCHKCWVALLCFERSTIFNIFALLRLVASCKEMLQYY